MTGTPELAKALAEFQAEMPTVTKGNKANVPTKSGGSYSYTYADLADVTRAAMPLLARHGLSFTAEPEMHDSGARYLRGVLMHSSGEERSGVLPLAGATPQELGSSITYMRRYLLGCLTGIVTDDDDDGQNAQRAATRPARTVPANAFVDARETPPETAALDAPSGAAGTEKMQVNTRRHLFALLHEKGIPDGEQLRGINHVLGLDGTPNAYTSRAALSEVDAYKVIDHLRTLPDPQA